MVHRREVNGKEIFLGNQGHLYGNAMTWWDHETGSVWSQPTGQAILGPLKGERLELLSSNLTTWAAWRAEYPNTAALDAPGDITIFNLSQTVVVVDFGSEVMTFRFIDLWNVGPANEVVAGVPIAVVTDPADRDLWAVFNRQVGDRVLTLSVVDGRLVDRETGTAWDPVRGFAVEGPLMGEGLALMAGFTAFPKDVGTFWPQARSWDPSGS
jgi:hypothetical protein